MKKKIISIFLTILLVTGFTTASLADSLQTQKENINEEIDNAQKEQKEVQEEKKTALEEIDDLDNSITSYENQISKLNSQISNLEKTIKEKEKEIKKLEADYTKKDSELQEKLVNMQKYGQVSYLDVLLGSDSIMDFISNANLVSKLIDADSKMMDELEATQKEVEKAKKEIETQKAELGTSKKSVEAKKKQLAVNKSAKEEKVASLNATDKKLQEQIDKNKKELKEIDEKIRKQAEQAADDGIYNGDFSGTLSWPLSSNSQNYNVITSYFGSRVSPTEGASSNHRGIDIGVSTGTPVYSSADGYVLSVQYTGVRGLFILIKHGDNLYTRYQHLSSSLVSAGQYVKRGQKIAKSGNTGIGTGPHLHFEVLTAPYYLNEVNPLNYTHW